VWNVVGVPDVNRYSLEAGALASWFATLHPLLKFLRALMVVRVLLVLFGSANGVNASPSSSGFRQKYIGSE